MTSFQETDGSYRHRRMAVKQKRENRGRSSEIERRKDQQIQDQQKESRKESERILDGRYLC